MTQPSAAKRILHRLMALDLSSDRVDVEHLDVVCAHLPPAFDGARIAVVSDVHLPDAMLSPKQLASVVAAQQPDVIFLVGDLTNSYTYFDERGLRVLIRRLTAIAPCYAIPGNHELRLGRETLYRDILTQNGVHYMRDSYADWTRRGHTLRVYGMATRRPAPLAVRGQPAIVLAHKPNYLPYYRRARWDLVISGHAHGGQMCVAGRTVYAPGQGLFPTYTGGVYRDGNTVMVVSRGLGNSSIPWRLGNHAHLPIVRLRREADHSD